jgi:hypothetical protein
MPAPAQIKVLRVSARAEGYRREGLKFGKEEVDIPESILTSKQIHRFKHDPMLSCEEVLVSTEPPAVTDEELALLREKAVIADAFLAKLPEEYSWTQCPSEYVAHLQNRVRELELAKAQGASTGAAHAAKQGARK